MKMSKEELKKQLADMEAEEAEEFMDSAPTPPDTEEVATPDKLNLEYKIFSRRLKDIEEQLGKRGKIEEMSEFRANRPCTKNEMLNKQDIVLFELEALKTTLISLGLTIPQDDDMSEMQ